MFYQAPVLNKGKQVALLIGVALVTLVVISSFIFVRSRTCEPLQDTDTHRHKAGAIDAYFIQEADLVVVGCALTPAERLIEAVRTGQFKLLLPIEERSWIYVGDTLKGPDSTGDVLEVDSPGTQWMPGTPYVVSLEYNLPNHPIKALAKEGREIPEDEYVDPRRTEHRFVPGEGYKEFLQVPQPSLQASDTLIRVLREQHEIKPRRLIWIKEAGGYEFTLDEQGLFREYWGGQRTVPSCDRIGELPVDVIGELLAVMENATQSPFTGGADFPRIFFAWRNDRDKWKAADRIIIDIPENRPVMELEQTLRNITNAYGTCAVKAH